MTTFKYAACAVTLLLAFVLAPSAHAESVNQSEPLGYSRIYYNGSLVIRTPSTTESAALALCKHNHELNRWVNFLCTWNRNEIYREVGKAEYQIFINGALHGTTPLITRADARANCELNHKQNKGASVRCTWNAQVIYDKGPLIPVADLREYIDGKLFITSLGVGKAAALTRCTYDHSTNFPTKSMRCTWGDVEIYNKPPLR